MSEPILAYTKNLTSLIGAVLATASAVLIIGLFGMELLGTETNPYTGILAFLVLPAFFLLGLGLIPFGAWRARRRARRTGAGAPAFPVFDLNQGRTRRAVLVFVALSVVNFVILGLATYKGVDVMESVAFCGKACHSVMEPEHTTHARSPHARVRCTECHIGPGAPWFVKSKLSGAWQLVAVSLDLYPRPIPTPVENLRPARETCEVCHWPAKFIGDRLRITTRYTDDEQAVPTKTVTLMHVGGQGPERANGIHWHVDPDVRIRYLSDSSRLNVADVELTVGGGETQVFRVEGEEAPKGPLTWREMDCVDCHNRPTHIYGTPEGAVDEALQAGELDRSLPYVRREALRVITAEYASHAEGRQRIPAAFAAYYAESAPEVAAEKKESIARSGAALAEVWAAHVFPGMKVGWGTYPSLAGHHESPGCFRCHDNRHATAGGKKISQGCASCHAILAEEEEAPEILEQLGAKER